MVYLATMIDFKARVFCVSFKDTQTTGIVFYCATVCSPTLHFLLSLADVGLSCCVLWLFIALGPSLFHAGLLEQPHASLAKLNITYNLWMLWTASAS